MKIIVTADIHLKLWADKEYDASGLPKKLLEILNSIEQMVVYANKNNINTIVISGDTNDTKGIVAVRAFTRMRDIFNKYPNINWIIIHGNHDATTGADEQDESAIQLLNGDNVQLVLKPEVVFDGKILLLPHSKNIVNVLQDTLQSFDFESIPKILISHFGLDEAQLSSGISIRAGIRSKDLRVFPLTILGHYHSPQEIQHDTGTVYYCGSPVPVRRDEAHEEKRFLVVDIDTLSVESIPVQGYRRYVELILDENTDSVLFEQQLNDYKKEGHHIIVRKTIADIPLNLVDIIADNAQIIDSFEKDITTRGITSSMSKREQDTRYLEIMGITEENYSEYLKISEEVLD